MLYNTIIPNPRYTTTSIFSNGVHIDTGCPGYMLQLKVQLLTIVDEKS